MIKIGIVEDNWILRKNYEYYFKNDIDFQVVFCIEDFKMLQRISQVVQPDIILLDILLPSGNSIEQLPRIKHIFPSCSIIMLSGMTDHASAYQSFRNGANGFLLKSSSMDYVRESLLKAVDGGIPLSPMIAKHLFRQDSNQTLAETYPMLTRRELQIINLLKSGAANKNVATILDVSLFTINQHLKNIYKKLNINSKSELVALTSKFEN